MHIFLTNQSNVMFLKITTVYSATVSICNNNYKLQDV